MMVFVSVDPSVLLQVVYLVASKANVWVVKTVVMMVDWKVAWKVVVLVGSKDKKQVVS